MDLGTRIVALRKDKKWTQGQLAEKLFVSDKTVSSWEANRTEPGLEMIITLSEVFGCSASYLIYGDSKKNDIETEIKVRISKDEFDRISKFMKQSAEHLNEMTQKDTYYQPSHRKFLKSDGAEIDEWLRIGVRGNKKILNYKNWHGNMFCDEYEVEIDDEENLDKIFKVLGLEQIVVVDKVRNTYFYLDKYEVALDFVDNLGYFIEIEVKKYENDAYEEYDRLLRLAKKLGLNLDNIDTRGYPYHLIYGK